MIKRPLLGMFLMMTAGVLLGKATVNVSFRLPQVFPGRLLWQPLVIAGVLPWQPLVVAGMLTGLVAVAIVLAVGWYGLAAYKKRLTGKVPERGSGHRPGRKFVRYLLLLGAVLGLLRGGQQEWQYQNARRALETACREERQVYASGLITQVKQTETSISYKLCHCTLQTEGASGSIPDLTIYQSTKSRYQTGLYSTRESTSQENETEEPKHAVGDYVLLYGVPEELSEATNDGGYDEKTTCYANGIVGKFLSPEMKPAKATWYLAYWGKVLATLDCLVQSYRQAFQSVLPPENLGILEAMCLGRKEHLSQELKDAFQKAGISHILAISGVHISIVGMFLFRRIRRFRLSIGWAAVLAILLSFFFAVSTGSGTSALRAVVMFGVFLGSIFWGKPYDGLSSLAFAGILLLLAEPYCIVGASFQYSFAAVTGIFGVQELINGKYKKLHPLFSSLLVSLAAWLATLPLAAWYQYRITTYSMLLNLLVLPLATPILVGGLFGGGVKVLAGVFSEGVAGVSPGAAGGFIRLLGCTCTFAGNGLLKLSDLCILLLRGLAEGYGKLPGGSLLVGKPHWFILILFYFLLFILFIYGKNKKVFLHFMVMLPVIIILVLENQFYKNKVVFLDVGQGDGIYLESEDRRSYFIDGGSSSESQVGRYILQPFLEYHAREHIDVWFVSHCDSDHISGLVELLENGYSIGRIVFARDIVKGENFNRLVELAGLRGIPISYMGEGDFLQTDQVRFTSLRGEKDTDASAGKSGDADFSYADASSVSDAGSEEDPNDHCLVLLTEFVSGGQTFLFAGDSSIEAEEEFLPFLQEQLAGRSLFLMKADHHGSKNSNGEALLLAGSPQVVVISCGLNNRYGHPHEETLERFTQVGANIARTDQSGAISIKMEGKKTMLAGYRKGN